MTSQGYFAFTLFIVYFVYTLFFAIKFSKTTTVYTRKQKQIHIILIWLIPFFWIILLKSLSKSAPGSHHFLNKKNDAGFHESGSGYWGDSGGNDSGNHH
ncbi:MAG: hypothetical protein M3R17_03910 [Bacteroidota bacterium]|nr:hypothetical protein [Bacteroidota bacterium]